jgi:site-specific recombinase XerD
MMIETLKTFETLFTYPAVVRRHQEGPLAPERAAYLQQLGARGMKCSTVLRQARYSLRVAEEVAQWLADHLFDDEEIAQLASRWAVERIQIGRASGTKWPTENFRIAARDFLAFIGRLRPPRPPPTAPPGQYADKLADFIDAKQAGTWQSPTTCGNATWHVRKFLDYLEQRGIALADVAVGDVDAYFEHMAQRWGRRSMRGSGKWLKAWFVYCQKRGWVQRDVASAIMLPRLYRQEGLPIGPTWHDVGRMLAGTAGDDPAQLRDHAILRLLSVYALRSAEVRHLEVDDIDWRAERIRVVRAKTRREDRLPLEATVGSAIARYLRHGRPQSNSRVVFLTLRAPHRPLSMAGLYHIVERHGRRVSAMAKGRGPHGLRHACARHLVEGGWSYKAIGDHLGHRDADSPGIYAKVNLPSLRRVAFEELEGLV